MHGRTSYVACIYFVISPSVIAKKKKKEKKKKKKKINKWKITKNKFLHLFKW